MPEIDLYKHLEGFKVDDQERYRALLGGMNKLKKDSIRAGLATDPLFNDALSALSHVFVRLAPMERWGVFQINSAEPDTNIADHTLRQTHTTIEFSGIDLRDGRITDEERKVLCATAVIHDIGEIKNGDIPLPDKKANPRGFDRAEAIACIETMGEALLPVDSRHRLSEILVKVAMESLTAEDHDELLEGRPSMFPEITDWQKLADIFHAYESIGYMHQRAIPGINQIPTGYHIAEEFHSPLHEGDQTQFRTMIGLPPSEVPLEVRRAMLFSAVDRNTRKTLFDARLNLGLASARDFSQREDARIRRADRKVQSNIEFNRIHRGHKNRFGV